MNIEETNKMLIKAARAGDLDKAKEAIKHGANEFNYALRLSAIYKHPEIMEILIKHGADNFNGALYGAAIYGHPEIVESLIKHGANNFYGALIWAEEYGNTEIVEILKQKIKE